MKYKVWDKVRYLENTTESIAKVWEEYYITKTCNDDEYLYSLSKEKWVVEDFMWVKEDDIELVEEDVELVEEEFTVGEQVWCCNVSKEEAIKWLDTDRYKYYYVCKVKDWTYITKDSDWDLVECKYIVKIPKKEEMTLSQICEELGRDIKIVK